MEDLTPSKSAIIILSAKDENHLKETTKQFLLELEEQAFKNKDLQNIAFTLQMGREAMQSRLGIIVTSVEELKHKLRTFLYNDTDEANIFRGEVKKEYNISINLSADKNLAEVIDLWIHNKKYNKILEVWVKGQDIEWSKLYKGVKPKRLSLPTYQFHRERYWKSDFYTTKHDNIDNNKINTVEESLISYKREVLESDQKSIIYKSKSGKNALEKHTINYLKKLISSVSYIPLAKIESDIQLEAYGIDSIMIKKLLGELEKSFQSVPSTIFFEYQDIKSLAEYLIANYTKELDNLFHLETNEKVEADDYKKLMELNETTGKLLNYPLPESKTQVLNHENNLDIAIIGLSGRYPHANNINEYWENLKKGKDCVIEIPKERWDYTHYFDKDKYKSGKIISKWGGFIDDVDKFDPLFFNISPEEAETMDPQERLFLQCVYETIEDAGYTRKSLKKYENLGLERNIGVFVGVTYLEYHLYGIHSQVKGNTIALSGVPSSIANRVSYFFNFHGPSMCIDSMCSSSLTALSIACDNIKQGGCKLAVVGGVNLSLHPNKYLFLSQYNFLSSKGRCESFGNGGDGYVPGEGIGAILLKPLYQAEVDGDHIYGVIKSSAVNHGGKTNGYSVPNPVAQAYVINKALFEGNINPRTISYIEAHGTGTSLGDPIEIAGLTKAFNQYSHEVGYCSIGSVKSNIGHLEAAAGIASITKVLLQMKYKKLVPSLHSEVINPNINLDNTPFKLQHKLEEWVRPIIEIEKQKKEYPRRAGVSSFGAGGSNSHVIIEEYISNNEEQNQIIITAQNPALIVLSAKNETQLKKQIDRLLEAIKNNQFQDAHLACIAYTLQVGRESMDERIGLIVRSINELQEKLELYLKGKSDIIDLFRNNRKKHKDIFVLFKFTEEFREAIDKCIEGKKYSTLLDLWTAGFDFDWEKLYTHNKPKKISLPTYPFAQERFWHPAFDVLKIDIRTNTSHKVDYLHPLLHKNTSSIKGLSFNTLISEDDSFLKYSIVDQCKILSTGAYLEMIRAAITELIPKEKRIIINLRKVFWSTSFKINSENKNISISIYPESEREFFFEIYDTVELEEASICCQGQADVTTISESNHQENVDINQLQAQCRDKTIWKEIISNKLLPLGINKLYTSKNNAFAKLFVSKSEQNISEYVLQPNLIESAIQAAIIWSIDNENIDSYSPLTVNQVKILDKCRETMWTHIRKIEDVNAEKNIQKVDIDLYDEEGKVCLQIKEFVFIISEKKEDAQKEIDKIILCPVWKKNDLAPIKEIPDIIQHTIILCEPDKTIKTEDIEGRLPGVKSLILESLEKNVDKRFEEYIKQLFNEIKSILRNKPKGYVLFQVVIFPGKEKELFNGLGGFLKTAQIENPKLLYQIIQLCDKNGKNNILDKLKENAKSLYHCEIKYINNLRYVKDLEEIKIFDNVDEEYFPWKEGGIYLLTGGAGGLGLIFTEEIAKKTKNVKLILTGRSKLEDKKENFINALRKLGVTIEYKRVDISQEKQVKNLITNIIETYGELNGILHGAGVVRDNFIINKTQEEIQAVLKPKVTGLFNLDQCTKDLNLDFICLFSSRTAVLGNLAQADYAAANAFLDNYAIYRNKLALEGKRYGKTISINWPLWQKGGMHIDKEIVKIMFERTGMIPMETETGIKTLYKALSHKKEQLMILEGNIEKIKTNIFTEEITNQISDNISRSFNLSSTASDDQIININILKDQTILKLKELFGKTIKLSIDKIDELEPFETYGVDSIKLTLLNKKISEYFKELSNTILFEYNTINALAHYLVSDYPQDCIKWIENKKESEIKSTNNSIAVKKNVISNQITSPIKKIWINKEKIIAKEESIAVIGMSGRFPKAENLDKFWENLIEGKNCITQLPQERWSLNDFYNPDKNEAIAQKQSYSKWGGFLEGFANFDPLFFNISPVEAERMDPQERIFLEECWKAFEDAGYVPSKIDMNLRKQIGVYGAITKTGFSQWNSINNKFYNTSFSSLVNRVSYFMNFQGPSISVDTMCSSSLAALHQACESIKHGTIKMAIVGAVNLYLHPSNYTTLSQAGLISDTSQSKVFGKGGIGFVPSEGVGAVVLKPLSLAEKDNDNILALIKGSALLHSGKTNGYNIPDPDKQANVIQQALTTAQIDPLTIRHIEVAASGSEMVDAIEMSAISKVFKKHNDKEDYYTMGSIKSLLGHGEAVSGMAQFIKAILQLNHNKLCPSYLPDEINTNINFETIPFKINTNQTSWSTFESYSENIPRRIGINNFGAGGVYAHLILEEYRTIKKNIVNNTTIFDSNIFIISAKNNNALRKYLNIWKEYFEKHPDVNLNQLSYILQTKREVFKRKFACIAQTSKELINNIKDYLNDVHNENIYTNKEEEYLSISEVDNLIRNKDLTNLAKAWVNGISIPWKKLYNNYSPKNISQLPTYPFNHKKFWVYATQPEVQNQSDNQLFIPLNAIIGSQKVNSESLKGNNNSIFNISHKSTTNKHKSELILIEDKVNNPIKTVNDTLKDKLKVQNFIREILIRILYLDDLDEFDNDSNFIELGLNSILTSKFVKEINKELGLNIKETVIFDYPNTFLLADFISSVIE